MTTDTQIKSKPLIKSKTLQGQTALLGAFIFALFNGSANGFNIAEIMTAAIAVAGYAYGVYGRLKAKVPLVNVITQVADDFDNNPNVSTTPP